MSPSSEDFKFGVGILVYRELDVGLFSRDLTWVSHKLRELKRDFKWEIFWNCEWQIFDFEFDLDFIIPCWNSLLR